MQPAGSRAVMPVSTFQQYRELARQSGYCEPWAPYVGPDYLNCPEPRFMYCGGAAWWDSDTPLPRDDFAALQASISRSDQFVASGMYSTPFWRLYRDAVAQMPWSRNLPSSLVDRRVCWTNLTKTGVVQQTAPPDSDEHLRCIDVIQMNHELALLRPDIILCVSGTIVPTTGHALFGEWAMIAGDCQPSTASTWFRRAPQGSLLMWTMHPAYKPRSWRASVLRDLRKLIEMFQATSS